MTYCWQKRGVSSVSPPTRFDQYKTLTGLSTLRPEFAPYGITVCRGTLQRLDEAFKGFFRRVKKGQHPGYPRVRSAKRFDSVSWPDVTGWKLDESARRLYLQGVGHVKLNLHRPLRGVAKTLTVRRRARHLEVTVFCSKVPKNELPATGRSVGIDLGVGVLAATSDGVLHPNPRHRRQLSARLAGSQREKSRHRRGSYRYKQASARIARLKEKEANRRKDALRPAEPGARRRSRRHRARAAQGLEHVPVRERDCGEPGRERQGKVWPERRHQRFRVGKAHRDDQLQGGRRR